MTTPFVPGFSPYNVPVRQGKRVGGEQRAALGQPQTPTPQPADDRRGQPAVNIRLSREALAFLGHDAKALPQAAPAKATPSVSAPFNAALEDAASRQEGPAQATRGATPYTAYVAPGSKVNVLV